VSKGKKRRGAAPHQKRERVSKVKKRGNLPWFGDTSPTTPIPESKRKKKKLDQREIHGKRRDHRTEKGKGNEMERKKPGHVSLT